MIHRAHSPAILLSLFLEAPLRSYRLPCSLAVPALPSAGARYPYGPFTSVRLSRPVTFFLHLHRFPGVPGRRAHGFIATGAQRPDPEIRLPQDPIFRGPRPVQSTLDNALSEIYLEEYSGRGSKLWPPPAGVFTWFPRRDVVLSRPFRAYIHIRLEFLSSGARHSHPRVCTSWGVRWEINWGWVVGVVGGCRISGVVCDMNMFTRDLELSKVNSLVSW